MAIKILTQSLQANHRSSADACPHIYQGASINLRIVMSGHPGILFSRSTTELVLCFRIARHPVLAVQRFQCLPPHQADYHPNRQLGSAPSGLSDTRQATHIFAILTGAGTWSVWTAVVDSTGPIADSPAIIDGSAALLEPTADLRSRISVLYVPDVQHFDPSSPGS